MSKKRIAFVCQRYGMEVNGGSELYCRQMAEHLSQLYDVTVYTTCAKDYITWKNEYGPGDESIQGVRVRRFPVARERNLNEFSPYDRVVFSNPGHGGYAEEVWVDAQGPCCPALVRALEQEHGQYQAVLLMTYLYYPTVRCLALREPFHGCDGLAARASRRVCRHVQKWARLRSSKLPMERDHTKVLATYRAVLVACSSLR